MATLVDLSDWLNNLKIDPQQDDLQRAAENQVARIKERTAQAVAVDLQIFAPYSPATDKKPPVNLRETGEMLDSITVESNNTTAHIFFNDPVQAQKASFHNTGTKHLPQRFFFGVSLQDREEIVGDIRAAVFRRLNK